MIRALQCTTKNFAEERICAFLCFEVSSLSLLLKNTNFGAFFFLYKRFCWSLNENDSKNARKTKHTCLLASIYTYIHVNLPTYIPNFIDMDANEYIILPIKLILLWLAYRFYSECHVLDSLWFTDGICIKFYSIPVNKEGIVAVPALSGCSN